jgi:hypothetical protein
MRHNRGVPTEEVLAEMRSSDPPIYYLVGTPKGRLSKLEADLLERPWQSVRPGVEVKVLPQENELYVFAQSQDRFKNRQKLRQVRRREGRYLLRTNLRGRDPAQLWEFYIQLVQIEAAFKNLKDDLALRPIFHQLEHRIEAHIFVAFIAYCLHVTLRARLRPLAPGLTARAVLDKFAAIQMLDVHFPTTDGRTLILSRYTHPEPDHKLLLEQLKLTLRLNRHRALAPAESF